MCALALVLSIFACPGHALRLPIPRHPLPALRLCAGAGRGQVRRGKLAGRGNVDHLNKQKAGIAAGRPSTDRDEEQEAPTVACHLELMGLPDSTAYRRLSRSVLQTVSARNLLLGLNVPNKKPGEPLLEWAEVLRDEMPNVNLCMHYSLKHQRGKGDPVECFAEFCRIAVSLGVARVLLVTGPRGPRSDTVYVLEQLARKRVDFSDLKLGVAFNACLPTEEARALEKERLVRKLKTGLVTEVWLNCGDDVELLDAAISFARTTAVSLSLPSELQLFGSVLLPNPAQLQQMRERPWNGVHFGEDYLRSLAGMERCTRDVLKLYGSRAVQPIVESKVRTNQDVNALESLLASLRDSMPSETVIDGITISWG